MRDEVVLLALLTAALALFLTGPGCVTRMRCRACASFLDTAVLLISLIVSVLAYVRFSVERRRFDLYLLAGFFVMAAATRSPSASRPTLDESPVGRAETWAAIAGRLVAAALIAAAPFAAAEDDDASPGARALGRGARAARGGLGGCSRHSACRSRCSIRNSPQPDLLRAALALQALLSLVALVGFGLRYRRAATISTAGSPSAPRSGSSPSCTRCSRRRGRATTSRRATSCRLLSYGVLLVGVWQAIRAAEFGRAVSEERARVAREIHDGLAQYLFAISTETTMLADGADLDKVLPRLREASAAAQQEARFAVLALSSAGGTASFDAALTRYVDFLTADGRLDVDLEIEKGVDLGPDEQIEVFRIVQEGLANVRRHAAARNATVLIGVRDGRRVVRIVDDGRGLDEQAESRGQGLRNIRTRATAIGGALRLLSRPGGGTSLEIVLRG